MPVYINLCHNFIETIRLFTAPGMILWNIFLNSSNKLTAILITENTFSIKENYCQYSIKLLIHDKQNLIKSSGFNFK